ncbi:MAG: HAD hydrolase family protein [Elusimicrobia bacterium]|nr:HAD hydrolase family protein [Elusimicrobiota bacterium]MBD3411616.1 HAD hydrolase family protein [Elusimicrobiota bacterium]
MKTHRRQPSSPRFSAAVLTRAKKIKLIAMDIDGVLNTGDILVRESGEEVKSWNVRDRIAFYFAGRSSVRLRFAWITGRGSRQVQQRAAEIPVDALYEHCMDKKSALLDIMKKFSLSEQEIAYIGDDLIDLPVLKRVGLSVCPRDAANELKPHVDFISTVPGGKGVLREVVELVLTAYGEWDAIIRHYLN